MKIYQVIRSGGQWEDAYEYVVGTFLKEKNAIQYKEELKTSQEIEEANLSHNLEICGKCMDDNFEDILSIEQFEIAKAEISKRCPYTKELGCVEEVLYVDCDHYTDLSNSQYDEDMRCNYSIRSYKVDDFEN